MKIGTLATVFTSCFLIVALVRLPLTFVLQVLDLGQRGISYARASGTVWNGEIAGLAWRGHALGAASVAVRPHHLLIGRLGVRVDLDGQGIASGGGYIALSPRRLLVRDLAVTANVAELPMLLELSGNVALKVARADLGRDGCYILEGSIHTDALVNYPAGLAWRGPELEGAVTCDAGEIAIPLNGDTESESVAVAMTLGPDGSFGIRVDARTPDPKVVSLLSAIGFVDTDGVMTLTQRGRWI